MSSGEDGAALGCADASLATDKEFVMEVMRHNGRALQHTIPEFQSDTRVVWEATLSLSRSLLLWWLSEIVFHFGAQQAFTENPASILHAGKLLEVSVLFTFPLNTVLFLPPPCAPHLRPVCRTLSS